MQYQKENWNSTNNSNGVTTAQAPKSPVEKLINEFFSWGNAQVPVETLNFLLAEFFAHQKKTGEWDPDYLAECVFETTRIVSFIVKLRELQKHN